ncbi:NBR1-Ig-like domain-containing protein [Angustibacter luteus]|uniref:NBR1-Ig-like domain-containing protein n=1 Tax=Angustibacter luteus TaxID=658456 RepID=A0ABW1JDG4_9ACTN
MAGSTAAERAQAIEGFAAVLSDLRDSVGKPSFRTMAGRSRAISHTTLHEAAQGNRLPSWGTTAEFVRACGADPADYRERWEQANRVVSPAGTDVRAEPAPAAPTAPPSAAPSGPDQPVRRRRPGRYAVLAAAAAVLVVAGAGVAWAMATRDKTAPRPPARYAASDCPVHQTNPPVEQPEHRGDRASFVADLTLPDCAHVPHGQTVTKAWRFKNTGTVAWSGYTLHRVDEPQRRDQCQTISDIPVPDTAPGKMVDVKVDVTAPTAATFCFVRFKMVDGTGRVAFPGSRPVNFQLIVD